jgi:hypothetical protein
MRVRKEDDYVQPPKSDARTHRTPKALTCEIKEALFPFCPAAAGLWECARVLAPLLLAWLEPATNSVQCPIETHFQRLLHGNLNSPKSDARTHRTPKHLRAKSMEALFPVSRQALGVRARPRAAFAGVAQSRSFNSGQGRPKW